MSRLDAAVIDWPPSLLPLSGFFHERIPASPRGRNYRPRRGATPTRRCTCGPRSSARSGWRDRRGSTIPGTSRSTSPARTDDVADPGRRPHLPDRFRLHRPQLAYIDQRRRAAAIRAGRPICRELLCRCAGGTGGAWHSRRDRRDAERIARRRSSFRRTPRTLPTIPMRCARFLQILVNSDRVFKQFRTGFLGKASPVHFFWGSFDLAVTRFSGRRAPRHPGGVPQSARRGGAAKPIRTK